MSHGPEQEVILRAAGEGDIRALRWLAERDSSSVPDGALLVAAVEGEIRAAVSLLDGRVIADPFHATAPLVDLLVLRAAQVRPRRRRGLRPPRPALGPVAAWLRPSTS